MQATYDQIQVLLKGDLPSADSIQARARAVGARTRRATRPRARHHRDRRAVRRTAPGRRTERRAAARVAAQRTWPSSRAARPGCRAATRGWTSRSPSGSRILATGAGTVLQAGDDPVYGRFVVIGHGGGYESLYGHASRLLVHPHEHVRARAGDRAEREHAG